MWKKLLIFICGISAAVICYAQDAVVFPQLGHTSFVEAVAFSPDGRYVLSGSYDHTLKLWDMTSGREIKTYTGHDGPVISAAFSADGRQFLSGSWDETVKLWDTISGRELKTFTGHSDRVTSVAFSPDGKQALSGCLDKTIKLWDITSGRELMNFSGHSGAVYSVAFSPDGKQIVSGSGFFDDKADCSVKQWDITSGRIIKTLTGFSSTAISVTFSSDGRQIISVCNDRTVKLWDAASGRETRTFFLGQANNLHLNTAAFSPDKQKILSAVGYPENTIKLWDIASGKELRSFSESSSVTSLALSADGRYALSGSTNNEAKQWDIAGGREIRAFSGKTVRVTAVALSPNQAQIFSGFWERVKLWDAVRGREFGTLSGDGGELSSIAFSPNGRQVLYSSGGAGSVKLLDLANRRESKTFSVNSYGVNSVAFSPDGKQALFGLKALFGSMSVIMELRDTSNGRLIRNFTGHRAGVKSVAFSPDGKQIVSGSEDTTVRLWDESNGRELKMFLGHTDVVEAVAFSPDGRQAISGARDHTVKLWDTVNGRELKTFSGHTNAVSSVAFSPDGKLFISGSWDSTVKLWDTVNWRLIKTFSGHVNSVSSVAFSSDGKRFISGSSDGTVRVWDVATGKEIVQFISFTDGEWIVITPEGYYNASPYGDKYLNVRVGNNVYGINQYKTTFYRPQIVQARLGGNTNTVTSAVRIEDADKFEPPRVTIQSPAQGTLVSSAQVTLSVIVEDQKQPIKDIKIYVKERLVGSDELSKLTGARNINIRTEKLEVPANQRRVEFNLPVTLEPGNNKIQVIASNSYSESDPSASTVEVFYQTNRTWDLPNLWILAVGINKYDSPILDNLNYAVNDAREIVAFFKTQEGKRFGKVNSLLITDDTPIKPTAENIINNIDSHLGSASQHDVILLFLAGHGLNDSQRDFFFAASNTKFTDNGQQFERASAVPHSEIMRIKKLPGKKLIFIDACHSENVGGGRRSAALMIDNNDLIREIMETSTVVFTSSTGRESSLENARERHGAFTWAILQGLKGEADYEKNGRITMKMLDTYVSSAVPKLTNNAQHPTTTVKGGSYIDFVIAVTK